MLPEPEIDEIVESVQDWQDENWNPVGDTAFDGEQLYGGDGDWPDWPDQDMLEWVPSAIQEKFGMASRSFVSGPCLYFELSVESELVSAFQDAGYSVDRNDKLVRTACGYKK